MINFNNGVANVNETPGINANTIDNRPAATVVPIGTIYIATDTGNIYRSNGTTWDNIGGGGTTPGIQDVLAVNQAFNTNGNTINLAGYDFSIKDLIYPLDMQIFMSHADLFLGAPQYASFQLGISPNNEIISKFNGTAKGIYINYDFDFYSYGDNFYNIEFDTANNFIETRGNNAKYGLQIIPEITTIGDFDGNQSFPSYIQIDNQNGPVTIGAEELKFYGTPLQSSSAGGNSGQHLVITLNGTVYKISLLNP